MLTVLKNILKKAQLICSLFVCLFCIQAMGMQQIKDALDNTDDADARDLAEYIELNPDIDIKDFLKIILLGDGVNPHGNLGWSVAATKIRHNFFSHCEKHFVILHGDLKGKGGCSFFVADVEKYKPINSNKAFYDNDIAQIFYDAVLQTFIDNHTFEVVSGNVVADVRIHAKEGKGPCIVVKGHTKNEELVTQHSGINISSCKFTGFNAVMKDTGDIKACTKAAFVFNLLNCLFSQTEDSGGTFYPSAVG